MIGRGFSLIEVIISASMLSVGLAAILTAYGNGSHIGAHQERVTVAMHLAEAQLEEALLLYPDADELKSVTHPAVHYTIDGNISPSASYFSTLRSVEAGPIPKTRKVSVTVSWSEPTGPQTFTLTTHRS